MWRCHHWIRNEIWPVSFSHPGTLWSFLGSEVAHTSSRSAPALTIKHAKYKNQPISPNTICKHYQTIQPVALRNHQQEQQQGLPRKRNPGKCLFNVCLRILVSWSAWFRGKTIIHQSYYGNGSWKPISNLKRTVKALTTCVVSHCSSSLVTHSSSYSTFCSKFSEFAR